MSESRFGDTAPAKVSAAKPAKPAASPAARSARKPSKRAVTWIAFIALVIGGVAMGYQDCSRPRVTLSTVRNARVLVSSGATPVKSGASCTFRLDPAEGEPYNCRVEIRCDGHVLFGAKSTSGFAHCQVDAGVATRAHESEPDDSDPDIDYDAAARRVIVKDRAWQVELAID